jgi:hypothetical protein
VAKDEARFSMIVWGRTDRRGIEEVNVRQPAC